LVGIIVETQKIIHDDGREKDIRVVELLKALVKKEAQYFLKDIFITIDAEKIQDNTGVITIAADKKQELKIGIYNDENRMAKNIEIGFTFPLDFIIEKSNRYTIYTDKSFQIVRYALSSIHGNTLLKLNSLIITPLNTGDYKIQTFIKAENIETVYKNVNLKVTPRSSKEIQKEIPSEQGKGD